MLEPFFFVHYLYTRKLEFESVYLVEGETFGADPRVLGVIVTVVEDLAVKVLVGVVAGLFADAVEFALGQQEAQTIGFLLLLL